MGLHAPILACAAGGPETISNEHQMQVGMGRPRRAQLLFLVYVQVRTKQLDIAGAEEQVARLEGLVKEAKGATDKVQKEFNALSEKASEGCSCNGLGRVVMLLLHIRQQT